MFMYLPSPFLIILFSFYVSFPALHFPYFFSPALQLFVYLAASSVSHLQINLAQRSNNTQKTVLTRRSELCFGTRE
jgi:hypothetical protein